MKKYRFTRGHGVPAQIVGEVLESIEKREGMITPELFLEESRPEDSPTHNCFEWDDTVAAERFRRSQAYHTIKDLEVVVLNAEDSIPTKAFVNTVEIHPNERGVFKSINIALSSVDSRDIVIQNAKREMEMFKKKYAELSELAALFTEMDNAIELLSA